ncbi:MAG TPA: hypothetical protein IAB26_15595 [Candidatus Limivivens merdigallinarum]|uniref:Uroporphyrinogen decarboxylase (URO-D) domain-containing protein n=1 Tax=Candidatus Limivivens merdigallinarum TaxID=2840859 RepID=A0A9D0ZYK1_9FIRM|nr:hypothetical protein [Candidatus Limivivens merdigallinarum]
MTNRERERQTLNFGRPEGRGAVEETFYPWDLTLMRFVEEGLPRELADPITSRKEPEEERYLRAGWGEGVLALETYLGFDPVRRIKLVVPVLGEADGSRPLVRGWEDWKKKKEEAEREIEQSFSQKAIERVYGSLVERHERGEFSLRMNLEGFFWIPRELLGIEEHLYAFYDEPKLLHEINSFVLKFYETWLGRILEVVQPDVVYLQEDLSGKNGPMISPEFFEEFVGDYYRKLIPQMKAAGVENVFVDTDGDFKKLIPNFMAAGVDGFLPMDVNAGMDINEVRAEFPALKLIGSFNKLRIAEGREAIDQEFQRLLPVIRQGGYLPGTDHQVAPSTSLEHYRYYIRRLQEAMQEAGTEAKRLGG